MRVTSRSGLFAGLALLLAAAAPDAAGAQQRAQPKKERAQRVLTLHEINRDLGELAGGTPLDYIASARIAYGVTGMRTYDEFFRKSALTYGGFYYGRRLVDDATVQLKKFARSKAAVASLQDEIRQITQEADTTEWTTEQSLAVLEAAKKRDELSQEETFYFVAMSALMAATVPVVRASVTTAPALVRDGQALTRRLSDDFDPFELPQMAFSVNRSAQQLVAIPAEGTRLLEMLVVISRGFQLLSAES